MTKLPSLKHFHKFYFHAFNAKPDITECYMVIFVEQPGKTLLDWCENKWTNCLNTKINISKLFLSYNCDLVLNLCICSLSFKPEVLKLLVLWSP